MKILDRKSLRILILITFLCCPTLLFAWCDVLQIKKNTQWLVRDTSSTCKDTIFNIVDKMPEFPGGNDSLMRFIVSHIEVPEEAKRSGINGRVFIKFIITKRGEVTAPEVLKGIGKECDEAAIRVVQRLSDWIPGMNEGKNVNVYYVVPIDFKLGLDESSVVEEEMPEFPGGNVALMIYLRKNLRYPYVAKELRITGRVITQFVVDKEGKISHIKVLRAIGGGCDEEAVRLVKAMPAWKPGKRNGKEVSVYFTLPITFDLPD